MLNLFINLIFGHLVGDYLLQSKSMALKKGLPGWIGWKWCLFHCLVYTFAVCAFLKTVNPLAIAIVFLSHVAIDRWSLADKWLKLIRGRTFLAAYASTEPTREFDIAFTSIVYTVVDNTWHILIMYYGLLFLVK